MGKAEEEFKAMDDDDDDVDWFFMLHNQECKNLLNQMQSFYFVDSLTF